MAKTVLRVRQDGVAFYLNEGSEGGRGGAVRYRLSRTSDYGRTKDGLVKVNAADGQALASIVDDAQLFAACALLFEGKPKLTYTPLPAIRGSAGRWEGEAFGVRKSVGQGCAQPEQEHSDQPAIG